MDVHAEPVAGAVHVEGLVLLLLDERVDRAGQEPEPHEPARQRADARGVDLLERGAGLRRLDAGRLGVEHELDGRLLLAA